MSAFSVKATVCENHLAHCANDILDVHLSVSLHIHRGHMQPRKDKIH